MIHLYAQDLASPFFCWLWPNSLFMLQEHEEQDQDDDDQGEQAEDADSSELAQALNELDLSLEEVSQDDSYIKIRPRYYIQVILMLNICWLPDPACSWIPIKLVLFCFSLCCVVFLASGLFLFNVLVLPLLFSLPRLWTCVFTSWLSFQFASLSFVFPYICCVCHCLALCRLLFLCISLVLISYSFEFSFSPPCVSLCFSVSCWWLFVFPFWLLFACLLCLSLFTFCF